MVSSLYEVGVSHHQMTRIKISASLNYSTSRYWVINQTIVCRAAKVQVRQGGIEKRGNCNRKHYEHIRALCTSLSSAPTPDDIPSLSAKHLLYGTNPFM